MRVLYLANRIPWFGAHTGYEKLPDYVEAAGISSRTYSSNSNLIARAMGKAVSLLRGHGSVSQSDASVRLRLEIGLRRDSAALGHILYGEEHIPFWCDAPEGMRRRTVLTLHQPSVLLPVEKRKALHAIPHAIVLWQREIDWFRNEMTSGQVHFIPHGVDVDYFQPAPESRRAAADGPPRLLYVGIHMRNTAMLARIVPKLIRQRGDLQFDFLVPLHRRSDPGLAELAGHPNIHWHSHVDDDGLRELYRSARLLVLPMETSGANTAVVEAMACGLPIVTTDVGGIRDYGGGTVYPVVENNDDEGMLTLIDNYLATAKALDEASLRCRAFAVEQLAWPIIARAHAEIYRRIVP